MSVPFTIKISQRGTLISNTVLPETGYSLHIEINSKILKQNEHK
jgi:hypothetical protein